MFPRILVCCGILSTALVCGAAARAEQNTIRIVPVASQPAAASRDNGAWESKPLGAIRLDPNPAGDQVPIDQWSERAGAVWPAGVGRRAACTPTVFHWAPPNFAYQPLYFDDVPLERYGQSVLPAAQPLLSGVHFFGMFPIIPYKMGIDRTHDPVYTFGYYRVGSDAPPVRQRLPFEWDAALFEAGAWTGMVFALP